MCLFRKGSGIFVPSCFYFEIFTFKAMFKIFECGTSQGEYLTFFKIAWEVWPWVLLSFHVYFPVCALSKNSPCVWILDKRLSLYVLVASSFTQFLIILA